MLQCVAVCCVALQCVAMFCRVVPRGAVGVVYIHAAAVLCGARCCCVECVAVSVLSVLQCLC